MFDHIFAQTSLWLAIPLLWLGTIMVAHMVERTRPVGDRADAMTFAHARSVAVNTAAWLGLVASAPAAFYVTFYLIRQLNTM